MFDSWESVQDFYFLRSLGLTWQGVYTWIQNVTLHSKYKLKPLLKWIHNVLRYKLKASSKKYISVNIAKHHARARGDIWFASWQYWRNITHSLSPSFTRLAPGEKNLGCFSFSPHKARGDAMEKLWFDCFVEEKKQVNVLVWGVYFLKKLSLGVAWFQFKPPIGGASDLERLYWGQLASGWVITGISWGHFQTRE